MRTISKIGALAIAALLVGCSGSPPKRAFYYWKTQWSASPEILDSVKKNEIGELYLKFFDVGWDRTQKTAYPVSALEFQSPLPRDVEIIPVVYLVNTVFLEIPYEDVEKLADRVVLKVAGMAGEQHITFQQLQLDCDWTDSSRRNYFHFADLLSRKLKAEHKIVSATIRLHQIKYAERTGIPPVSRGMLMFYNFGKIQADSPGSSIFNPEDAARYSSFISSYPMNLDVVLPVFSWSVHSRDGIVLGLLENIGGDEFASFSGFQKLSPNRYSATRSFFFRGRYFMNGDLVLVEETTPEITKQAAALARRGAGWRKRYQTVALFDLDEKQLKKFSETEIRSILAAF